MRLVVSLAFAAIALLSGIAHAEVTGVVTSTTATVQFRPSAQPGDTGIQTFSGDQLSDTLGSNVFGSAGNFASTSRVGNGSVEFRNGNVASGSLSVLTSRTLVDVSFTNDGDTAVIPTLHSTIAPAGLGFHTCGNFLNSLASCVPGTVFGGRARNFDDFGPGADGKRVVGAAFTFRINGGGQVLYELQGSVDLLRDQTGANVVIDHLDAARQALDGFRMVSSPASRNEVGFVWDATDLLVNFAPNTLLRPGESSTLTYETEVSTYSFAQCYELLTGACLAAYSSFGDPIGRGGAALPAFAPPSVARGAFSVNAATSSEINFATFAFKLPEFRKGVLSYDLIQSEVPTPPTLTLLLIGLIGAALASRQPAR